MKIHLGLLLALLPLASSAESPSWEEIQEHCDRGGSCELQDDGVIQMRLGLSNREEIVRFRETTSHGLKDATIVFRYFTLGDADLQPDVTSKLSTFRVIPGENGSFQVKELNADGEWKDLTDEDQKKTLTDLAALFAVAKSQVKAAAKADRSGK